MNEEQMKKNCIKLHTYDEFPMSEFRKIDDAIKKLGYEVKLIYNGNVVYKKK